METRTATRRLVSPFWTLLAVYCDRCDHLFGTFNVRTNVCDPQAARHEEDGGFERVFPYVGYTFKPAFLAGKSIRLQQALMSSLWPKHGSVWKSREDVVLASQLAGLAEGYSEVTYRTGHPPRRLTLDDYIACRHKSKQSECMRTLVRLGQDPGNSGWTAYTPNQDMRSAYFHAKHPSASAPLLLVRQLVTTRVTHPPTVILNQVDTSYEVLHLRIGDTFVGREAQNMLEAQLRVTARGEGYYLLMQRCTTAFFVFCCAGRSECDFSVRLAVNPDASWTCTEIQPGHTCATAAPRPASQLRKRLCRFVSHHKLRDALSVSMPGLTITTGSNPSSWRQDVVVLHPGNQKNVDGFASRNEGTGPKKWRIQLSVKRRYVPDPRLCFAGSARRSNSPKGRRQQLSRRP